LQEIGHRDASRRNRGKDFPHIDPFLCRDCKKTPPEHLSPAIAAGTPIGVASYSNVHIKEIQEQLPTIEELQTRLRLLEEELDKKH